MNLLGKIFVVLIVVLSIVFMTLALAVYATHKNWKYEAAALGTQLQEANARFEQLQGQYNDLESRLTAERDTERQRLAKSEAERDALIQRNAGIQSELDQLKAERRDATAAVAVTQQNNQRLADEVSTLRDDIRSNQQARDRAFATTLEATEELHQVKGQLDSTLERSRQLTSQVANYTAIMDASGVRKSCDTDDNRAERSSSCSFCNRSRCKSATSCVRPRARLVWCNISLTILSLSCTGVASSRKVMPITATISRPSLIGTQ